MAQILCVSNIEHIKCTNIGLVQWYVHVFFPLQLRSYTFFIYKIKFPWSLALVSARMKFGSHRTGWLFSLWGLLGCVVYDGRPIGLGWSRGSWSLGPRREGLETTGLLPRPGFGLAWAPRPFLFFFLFHVLLKKHESPTTKKTKRWTLFFVRRLFGSSVCLPPAIPRLPLARNRAKTESQRNHRKKLAFLFCSSLLPSRTDDYNACV
jgi:hypothetical protein